MKDSALQRAVSSRKRIARDGFVILQEISRRLSQRSSYRFGVDMVMRALEHRDCFGALEEIFDAMVRDVGLFPYVNADNLSLQDRIADEYHRPDVDSDTIFHRVQAEVYRRLVSGENVILSAPTSFGKSRLIDDVIQRRRFGNAAVVVPTLALVDETRRRLTERFRADYKIVTHHSQEPAERNIFVMTPERIAGYEDLPPISFFVIDEFYKVGAIAEADDSRVVTLNHAFYKLFKIGGQFYLLGPNVKSIPSEVEGELSCTFFQTDFSTVVTEKIRVTPEEDESPEDALVNLCRSISEPTLIYCASPGKAIQAARRLVDEDVAAGLEGPGIAADWIGSHYSNEWVLPVALRCGIGVHHGRVPRAIGQYIVRAFNSGALRFLICTSTLIEGVNTSAKNVIVYDKKIARKNLDYFTFNNIVGRSGRMFQHFVGRVYLFHDPPQPSLPFVDFPFVTQDKAPPSLLVQLEDEDLSEKSESIVQGILGQNILPSEIIRENASIDPDGQLLLAQHIIDNVDSEQPLLGWSGYPVWNELKHVCELIWKYLAGERPAKGGVVSPIQLTHKINRLRDRMPYPDQIQGEIVSGYSGTADRAVDKVLDFERSWATFHFPRYLMALHRIQEHVLKELGESPGEYTFYAAQVESLFRKPTLVHLDEFGLPLPMLDDIEELFPDSPSLDDAIAVVRDLSPDEHGFDEFEKELLEHCKEGL